MTDPHPRLTPAASRRQLLTIAGLGLVGPGLGAALGGSAEASVGARRTPRPLGGLEPAGPELSLPPGFSYTTFGRAGTPMDDGIPTPGCHDGQALFKTGKNGQLRLIRNHEIDLDIPGTKQKALGARSVPTTGPRRPA